MSKKKSRRRVIKPVVPKVSTVFDCPFCNHKRSVDTKMDKKGGVASISCKACSANYKVDINNLTEPIDVYCMWLDESEKINREEED